MNAPYHKGISRAVGFSIAMLLFLFVIVDLGNANWETFHYDSNNTGFRSATFITSNISVVQLMNASGAIASPIIVSDGFAYFGSNDNKMYAVNVTTGVNKWTPYSVSNDIRGSAAIYDTYLVFGSLNNNVYALNKTDGSLEWIRSTGNQVWSSPKIDNKTVFIGSDDMKLYALNISDGSVLWNYTTNGKIRTVPAVTNTTVFVAGEDGTIYALNKTNGSLLWSITLNTTIYSSPAVEENRLYVGSYNGVYCINYSWFNGTNETNATYWDYSVKWNYATTAAVVYSSPAIDSSYVYVGDTSGRLYKLAKTTGSLQWAYTTNGAIDSSPAVTSNVVAFGSKDNSIYILSTSGTLLKKYATGDDVDSSPASYSSYFYVGSSDYKLYTLGPGPQNPVISNIKNTTIADTTAIITFTTNVSTNATIEWGINSYSYFWSQATTAFETAHSFTLTNLPASSTIYYRITVSDEQNRTTQSSQYSFSTINDQIAPTMTIISPSNNSLLPAATSTVNVILMTDKNASCRYSLYDAAFSFATGTNMTQMNSTHYTFSYTNGSSLESTILYFYYRCRNNNGNISEPIMHKLTVIKNDGVAPVITVTSLTNFLTNNVIVDFNITSNENLSSAKVVIDGSEYLLANVSGNLTKWSYSASFEYGNYTFFFNATDPDGNSKSTDTYWFFVNYTEPDDPLVVNSPGATVEAPAFELSVTTREPADCYYSTEKELNFSLEQMEYPNLMDDHYNNTLAWATTEHKELLITQSGTQYINIKCVYNGSVNETYYTRIGYLGILEQESESLRLEDESLGLNDKLIYYEAGSDIGITINHEVLVDIALVVNRNIRPFTFRVHESREVPPYIFKDAPGKVYRYLEVNRSGISNDDIKRGILRFKVRNSWMEGNNLNLSNITLMKYQDNRWVEVPTAYYRDTALHHYFVSNFTSLSVFAVTTKTTKPKPPVTVIVTGRNVTGTETGARYTDTTQAIKDFLDSIKGGAMLPLFASIILILTVIGIIVLLFAKDMFGIKTKMMEGMARRKIDRELRRKTAMLERETRKTPQKESVSKSIEERLSRQVLSREMLQHVARDMLAEQKEELTGKKTSHGTKPGFAPFLWITERYRYHFSKDKDYIRLKKLEKRIRQVKYETSRDYRPSWMKERWNNMKYSLRKKVGKSPEKDIHHSFNRINDTFKKAETIPQHSGEGPDETVKVQWYK